MDSKGTHLILYGMVFQIVGAAMRKPRWLITVFVVGKLSLSESIADRSARPGTCLWITFPKYFDSPRFKVLNVKVAILNAMRKLIGNQCNCSSRGEGLIQYGA